MGSLSDTEVFIFNSIAGMLTNRNSLYEGASRERMLTNGSGVCEGANGSLHPT